MSTIGEQTNGKKERQRLVDNSNHRIEHGDPPLLLSTSSSEDDECHFNTAVDDTVSFMPEEKTMPIDNTSLIYIPVHLPCGILVYCSPEVLSRCPMVLRSLQTDLIQCLRILPWSVHAFVRRTVIWVNFSYSYGSCDDPRVLRHSTAHHEDGWLVHWYACSARVLNGRTASFYPFNFVSQLVSLF
jgi:hypothetical protein